MDEPPWQLPRCQLCQTVCILLEVTFPSRPWHSTMGTKEAGDTNTVLGRLLKVCPTNVTLVSRDFSKMFACVLNKHHSLTCVPLVNIEAFELVPFILLFCSLPIFVVMRQESCSHTRFPYSIPFIRRDDHYHKQETERKSQDMLERNKSPGL